VAVRIAERIHCEGRRLAVRIVDTDDIVCFEPSPTIKEGENVIAWLGTNLVHVGFDDIHDLRTALQVIGVETQRLRVVDGAQSVSETDGAQAISVMNSMQ
jgi:hypothetical protein